jgi:hypothetical protein
VKFYKKVFWVLVAMLAAVQFIRPEKNTTLVPAENNIAQQILIPAGVDSVLRRSCYNCHSNNTEYPWYAEVQPAGWWLAGHIRDGKSHLNFDEFANYPLRRQYHKLEEIQEMVEADKMPLPSYLWMHREDKLSPAEKSAVLNWSIEARRTMESKHPADSLHPLPRPQPSAPPQAM